MDWFNLLLCLINILLALAILYFNTRMEVRLIVFLIVMCNMGLMMLGRNRILDNFVDYSTLLSSIQQFQQSASNISSEVQDQLSEQSKTDIMNQLNTLNTGLNNIAAQLNTAVGMSNGMQNQTVNFGNSTDVNQQVETAKQIQLAKLADLQAQLIKTQQIVNAQQNAVDTNKYKPIKIYSSCIVSNADGSYST